MADADIHDIGSPIGAAGGRGGGSGDLNERLAQIEANQGGGRPPPGDGMITWKSFGIAMFTIIGAYSALSYFVLDLRMDTVEANFKTVEVNFETVDAKFDAINTRLSSLEDGTRQLKEDTTEIKISQAKSQKDLEHIARMLNSKIFPEPAPKK
jgi:hypothetical protein